MSLSPGDGVELQQHLSSRVDLNGRQGRLREVDGDRWVVVLGEDPCEESVKVRPANLRRTQEAGVWCREMNGKAVKLQKCGDLEKAEQIWTTLLFFLATASDLETLKVIYSNRSASRLQRGSAREALTDAEKCVQLDITWEKGWLRKIDALEALGEVVRAYDVVLDGCKCLSKDKKKHIEERRARLESMPETKGFLREDLAVEPFCCACGACGPTRKLSKCEECMMVSYCGPACLARDAVSHGSLGLLSFNRCIVVQASENTLRPTLLNCAVLC